MPLTAPARRTTLQEIEALLDRDGLLVQPANSEAKAVVVESCSFDSRDASQGSLFFCKGETFEPVYLEQALERGSVCAVADAGLERQLSPVAARCRVPLLYVSDVRRAMALVSRTVYQAPDRELSVTGITGTKGKTSTSFILRSILDAHEGNGRTGLIGSIETFDGLGVSESHNTTPEAPALWRHLANARDARLPHVVMEVSSQALKYDRTLGLAFDVACFLNIGLDHISPREHADFEDYFSSKLRIFRQCETAVVNLDDTRAARMLEAARGARRALTFGIERDDADVRARDLAETPAGTGFTVETKRSSYPVELNVPGSFNVSNALAAVACAEALGVPADAIARGIANARVPGRMELYRTRNGRIAILVDYAHNALSFETLFRSLDTSCTYTVAVFGAPGGKAPERRRELPRIAAQHTDCIVLTSDDPWRENPARICREMEAALPPGFPHETVLDREAAAARAFELAYRSRRPALVLLLAKGHERYQLTRKGFIPCPSDSHLARCLVNRYDEGRNA